MAHEAGHEKKPDWDDSNLTFGESGAKVEGLFRSILPGGGDGTGGTDLDQFIGVNLGGAERSAEAELALQNAAKEQNQQQLRNAGITHAFDRGMGGAFNPEIGVRNMGVQHGFTPTASTNPWNPAKSATDPFDLTAANIAAGMTPEDLEYYQGIEQFVQGFNQDPSAMKPYDTEGEYGGSQTDPFQYGESALTNLQNQRAAMYADYFANQEGFAQDKYDSITSYLNELQIGADAQYQKDMADMSAQYDSMQNSRNERFAEAYARGGDRSGLAMDTLASLGITPDATTFDSVTGETDNMLFSQQQSGADMLNTMRFISNQMLDFGKSASSRSISAGLQQSEMALAQEMANIQLAKDSFAISEIEAAIAQEKATAEANAALARASEAEQKMNAYFITAGRVYAPEATDAELVAMGNTGLLDPLVQAAMQPGVPEPVTIPWGATPETGSPMTQEQLQMMATMHAMTNQGQAPQYYQDPVTGLTVPVESPSDLLNVIQAQTQQS